MGTVNIDATTIRTAIVAHATPSAIRAFLVRLFRSTARFLKENGPAQVWRVQSGTVLRREVRRIVNKNGLRKVNADYLLDPSMEFGPLA